MLSSLILGPYIRDTAHKSTQTESRLLASGRLGSSALPSRKSSYSFSNKPQISIQTDQIDYISQEQLLD